MDPKIRGKTGGQVQAGWVQSGSGQAWDSEEAQCTRSPSGKGSTSMAHPGH